MKKLSLFSALLLAAFLFPGCHKEKLSTVLPPATQEGKNTIGFKINGKVWTPGRNKTVLGGWDGIDLSVLYNSPLGGPYALGIQAGRKTEDHAAFFGMGSYLPIRDTGDFTNQLLSHYYDNGVYLDGGYDDIDFDKHRSFIITKLDTVQHIISGTFGFTLMDPNNHANTITISDGRFDFHY